jgi:predicted RNase H-like nuclease (RuvC/YqgF family)
MDSKDKLIADLRKQVQVLSNGIPPREAQISKLRNELLNFQASAAGVDAVRNSLQAERELTVQLNGQLETLKKQVVSLQEENEQLKQMNLNLQKQDYNKPVGD